jgi:hypothetical protein
MLFMVITWLLVAIYLGIAVAVSDGCQDPYLLGHKVAVEYLSSDNAAIVDYYVCVRIIPYRFDRLCSIFV